MFVAFLVCHSNTEVCSGLQRQQMFQAFGRVSEGVLGAGFSLTSSYLSFTLRLPTACLLSLLSQIVAFQGNAHALRLQCRWVPAQLVLRVSEAVYK